MGKLVNGELVDLTAEDIAQQEADTADYEAKKTAKEEAEAQAQADKEAKDNLKASAKAKLMSGEALTEDEANTIVL
jgi:Na+-transporting NADH:ubiquinone oxidoreductase subunit NqrC